MDAGSLRGDEACAMVAAGTIQNTPTKLKTFCSYFVFSFKAVFMPSH